MAQNIYDDERFFTGYAQLRRSVDGLAGAPEWETMRSLLPPVEGRRVLDLGCGFGWFCRWAVESGAASAVGIDVSVRMLERAERDTHDDRVTYQRADLDDVDLGVGRFDLAYSSLVLHYLADLDDLLRRVRRALVRGSALVVSVEHPIFTAPLDPGFTWVGKLPRWPVDSYLAEGERRTDWLAPDVIKQHRTIGTYVRSLRRAGFALDELIEWGPSEEQVATVPEWRQERHRPPFLLMSARAG